MPASSENTRRAKILLVEDNKDALETLSLLLELDGLAVATARNGLEALDQLQSDTHLSLVVLDLSMPVRDGWEFLRRKTEATNIANIPVIVLSGLPLSGYPDGVKAVIQKPVNAGRLFATIDRCLAYSRQVLI
jgi:CheY-like chemotaxis protein